MKKDNPMSKTDLKGRITEVNREFIETSGFSESELLGSSHNIRIIMLTMQKIVNRLRMDGQSSSCWRR